MKLLKLPPYNSVEQVSSSHLGKDLTEAFVKAGIQIEIHCPTPSRNIDKELRKKYSRMFYEEKYDGLVKIYRFRMFPEGKNPLLRAFRYLCCNLIQYFKGSKVMDADVIFGQSTPPTQGLLCGLVKRSLERKTGKKIPFIYILQDIFPDSLVNTGLTKKGSILWKIGRKIEDFTYRNADKIIVISEGFKKNIMAKGVAEEKIEVIPNWVDMKDVHPIQRQLNPLISELNIDSSKFIVLYAGNFGRAQGADIVIKAAERLIGNDHIKFVIFGGGAEFQDAVDYVEEKHLTNVIIRPLLPPERVSEVYSLGDIAVITCKEGMGSSCVPSKTWSIMACGTPILASFDLNSELCQLLHNTQCGVCVKPTCVEDFCLGIEKLYNTANLKQWGTRGLEYLYNFLNKEKCVEEYINIIMNSQNNE